MNRPSHNLSGLDIEVVRRSDGIGRRFEADWRAGHRPRVEDYLDGGVDAGRAALRAELIAL
jgi:hypothetical protein